MPLIKTHIDLHLDGERFVGRFTSLEPGHFTLEVFEPTRGEVWGYAYSGWLSAMAFHRGGGRRFLDLDGEITENLEPKVCAALRRWLLVARFFTSNRESLLAAKVRIVERLTLRAESVGWFEEADAVTPRPSPAAKVVALPRVGGIHHRYEWHEERLVA